MTEFQQYGISEPKPEFLTNWSGRTVADSLCDFINHASTGLSGKPRLDIATAYFNVGGYAQLADALDHVNEVRLLVGAEPQPPERRLRVLAPGSRSAGHTKDKLIRSAVSQLEQQLTVDRDLLGFTYEAEATCRRLVEWLRSPTVQVRRLEDRFLHGKAFLVGTGSHGVIAGSSNFTRAGLLSNVELNLGNYSPHVVDRAQDWFDELWEAAVDYDAAALFEPRFELHPPHLIYLRMLWERYQDEYGDEPTTTKIQLATFQEHGKDRAKRLLDRYKGVLIADEVGLGKTYIAGELISEAVDKHRQRVLVVAPATLRDGPWRTFLDEHNLLIQVVSFEELARDQRLNPDASGYKLRVRDVNDYAMVVIDEAHNVRNPSTQRAAMLRRLLAGTPRKKLVLLTATPVNNSLWDLYNLINYFLRNDAAFADIGIPSLRDHFDRAMSVHPDDLSPRHLFDVLDAVTVRRTRSFVKEHYSGDTINVGGRETPIRFPSARVEKVTYDLDEVLPGFLDRLSTALDSDARGATNPNGAALGVAATPAEGVLTLARYSPSHYLIDQTEAPESHELMLAGLLRSGMLKRFESSPYAFARTCERMAASCDAFLSSLHEGDVTTEEALTDWVATDSDDESHRDDYLGHSVSVTSPASAYNVDLLASHVEHDRDLLRSFAEEARTVTRDDDPTLAAIADELAAIAATAREKGIGDTNTRDHRKVLIFTYFADTVDWIHEYLIDTVERDPRLADYRGRIAVQTGSDSNRRDVLWGFAPRTTDAPNSPDGTPHKDRYDIVVSTDVLAEGVNLQQARNIINYDLPWNPMRLVQRHGRIDRIGSEHDEVVLRCVFPDRRLDDLLGLQERLSRKIKQAAASVGAPEVLPNTERIDRNFTETRQEIERLQQGDGSLFEKGGREAAAMSGEEFRQELRQELTDPLTKDAILSLPWGSGSAMAGDGFVPEGQVGFVFCIRVGDHPEPEFRYVEVPDTRDKQPQTGDEASGDAEPDEAKPPEVKSDTLDCLWAARPVDGASTPNSATSDAACNELRRLAVAAWGPVQAHFVEDWNYFSDKANLEPSLPKALHDAADVLRNHAPRSLTQTEVDEAVDALHVNYSRRVVQTVRVALRKCEDPAEQAKAVLKVIKEQGLEPAPSLNPRLEITEDDVHLVCWLALTPS